MLPTEYITQDWVAQATAQKIYDHVAKHLLTQNRKSELYGSCAYFGDTDGGGVEWPTLGLYCAAGCLLKDTEEVREFVNEECENQVWDTLVNNGYAPTKNAELIWELQCVHDAANPKDWLGILQQLAIEQNLKPVIIE